MRKIAVVTGTRAEYGILKPVLQAIQSRPGLKLVLVVTGMHLSPDFGSTVKEIEKDGFKISARVMMSPEDDTLVSMAASVGKGVMGMATAWQKLKPDIIVVLGDRTEALAGAVSGAYMNIPIAHVHGGDACVGGNIDDSSRYAITKFAHIHFPATGKSAARIIALGEEKRRVHTVGSPAVDGILSERLPAPNALAKKYRVDLKRPLVMVVQHPVTTQVDKAGQQMRTTLDAVIATGYPAVVIYPNSDAGSRKMIEIIKRYEKQPMIKAFKSLPRSDYLGLMKASGVLIGNSSSGIIDAPSLGVPAVNIGIRQEGRERGNNVIDVDHTKSAIIKGIGQALNDKAFLARAKKGKSPYGDGKASQKIAKILSEVEINQDLLRKRITY